MKLYQKWLLAFTLVILIAVGVVAFLVGRSTETEFRRYAFSQGGGVGERLVSTLADYYAAHGSWDGLQTALPAMTDVIHRAETGLGGGGRGQGRGRGATGDVWAYVVANQEGQVIAGSEDVATGSLSPSEREQALLIEVHGQVVGYLFTEHDRSNAVPLEEPAEAFLSQMRVALLLGAGVAFVVALVVGGLLVRSIVSPIRDLTRAAQTIAAGDLQARALAQGRDEVAQLASTFNQMAESLDRAEDARRAQTADIAHELRNPLAVLQGTLEALADGIYEPTAENIEPALDQVRTLNRLVEDLRLLAKADAGELRLEQGPLAIKSLLQRTVEAHRASLVEQDLALYCDVPDDLPPVFADADRLAQVVGNVLGNALRYVPASGERDRTTRGEVRVTAAEEKGGVVVRIADNGPGVPAEDLSRVFKRFWRGERSRSRITGGAGLGLAIARQIIEAHHGRIWAEATPGGGLTVAFWLPALSQG